MNPSQRVILVLQDLPTHAPFLWAKFSGLLRKGLNVEMLCLEKKKRTEGFLTQAEIRRYQNRIHYAWSARSHLMAILLWPSAFIICLTKNLFGTLRYFWKGAKLFGFDMFRRFYLDAAFISLRPDVIHFEFGPLAADRMHLRGLLGCKIIVSLRGYDLNYVQLDKKDYYSQVWQKADALHLLGNDLWQRAQRRGCPSEKPHVLIPPAINTDLFSPQERQYAEMGTTNRPLKILSVGRLVWKKGYEYALQAVKLLKDQGIDCHYNIIGDGPYKEAVAFTRLDLGLESEVHLLGNKTPAEVKEHMQQADVFLHAAISEGFCNAVIEAQSMQLPVVCTDADGLAENVVDGVTGFVVPRRDPETLATKLALLAKDPNLRQKMGLVGRARAVHCFKLESQIQAFEDLYKNFEEKAQGDDRVR